MSVRLEHTSIQDVLAYIQGHNDQIAAGIWLKAAIALIATVFTDFMFGKVIVFYIYVALACTDFALGYAHARAIGTYDPRRVKYWVRKVLYHGFVVVLCGALAQSAKQTFDITLGVVNFLLFMFSVNEAASIYDKLKIIGMKPIPLIDVLFTLMRRKSVNFLVTAFNDPEAKSLVEKALNLESQAKEKKDED